MVCKYFVIFIFLFVFSCISMVFLCILNIHAYFHGMYKWCGVRDAVSCGVEGSGVCSYLLIFPLSATMYQFICSFKVVLRTTITYLYVHFIWGYLLLSM